MTPGKPLPERLVWRGRLFRRSRIATPRFRDQADYREVTTTRPLLHLYLLPNAWRIDHMDEADPDAGPLEAARHLLRDAGPHLWRLATASRIRAG